MSTALATPAAEAKPMQDIVTMTARLAQILAEEVDLLTEMKVGKIAELQEEKLFLTAALDARKRAVQKNPKLRDALNPAQREELRKVVEVFNNVLRENHRKLQLAKQVNQKIIGIIRDVVRETVSTGLYNGNGQAYAFAQNTLSVTLNRRI